MQVHDYDLAPGLRFIWWTARTLVVTGILLCVFVLPQMVAEIADSRLPFVIDGHPFGTPGQPARLKVLVLAVGYGIALIGYIVSFWRERLAGWLLLASVVFLLPPDGPSLAGLFFAILPPVFPGVLLLLISEKAPVKTSPTTNL
jgi:hypothetical protein